MLGHNLFSTVLLAFPLVVLLGCNTNKTGQPTSQSVSQGSPIKTLDSLNPVPVEVVRKIPARIKELKPGMTLEQVLGHLGLGEYPLATTYGGGAISDYSEVSQLRKGYNLV